MTPHRDPRLIALLLVAFRAATGPLPPPSPPPPSPPPPPPPHPCPWLSGPTATVDLLQCGDGSECTGWSCCNDRGKRAKCPPNSPNMCARDNDCAGASDHCCEKDCSSRGGIRPCEGTPTSAPVVFIPCVHVYSYYKHAYVMGPDLPAAQGHKGGATVEQCKARCDVLDWCGGFSYCDSRSAGTQTQCAGMTCLFKDTSTFGHIDPDQDGVKNIDAYVRGECSPTLSPYQPGVPSLAPETLSPTPPPPSQAPTMDGCQDDPYGAVKSMGQTTCATLVKLLDCRANLQNYADLPEGDWFLQEQCPASCGFACPDGSCPFPDGPPDGTSGTSGCKAVSAAPVAAAGGAVEVGGTSVLYFTGWDEYEGRRAAPWTLLSASTAAERAGAAACVIGAAVWQYGGLVLGAASDDLLTLRLDSLRWTAAPRGTPWPSPLVAPSVACDAPRGAVYLLAHEVHGFLSGELWAYDVAEAAWERLYRPEEAPDDATYCPKQCSRRMTVANRNAPPLELGGAELASVGNRLVAAGGMFHDCRDGCSAGLGAGWYVWEKDARQWLLPGAQDDALRRQGPAVAPVGRCCAVWAGGTTPDGSTPPTLLLNASAWPPEWAPWPAEGAGAEGGGPEECARCRAAEAPGGDGVLLVGDPRGAGPLATAMGVAWYDAAGAWAEVPRHTPAEPRCETAEGGCLTAAEWWPPPRAGFDVVTYRGVVVVIGGAGGEVWAYDPAVCPRNCTGRGACIRGACRDCELSSGAACEVPEPRGTVTTGLSTAAAGAIAAVAGALLIVVAVLAWRYHASRSHVVRLKSTNEMMEDLVQSVATMELDSLSYLFDIDKPTRMQTSLRTIVELLQEVRAYLPQSILPQEEEDDDWSSAASLKSPAGSFKSPDPQRNPGACTPGSHAGRRGTLGATSDRSDLSGKRARSMHREHSGTKRKHGGTRPSGSSSATPQSRHVSSVGDSPRLGGTTPSPGGNKLTREHSTNMADHPGGHGSMLSVGVNKKHVSLVPVNVRGYHSTNKIEPSAVDRFHQLHLDCLLDALKPKGVLDMVFGDHARATFNAARPCVAHRVVAAECALRMSGRGAPEGDDRAAKVQGMLSILGVQLSVGATSGSAVVGCVGGTAMKSFAVLATLCLWASALERLSAQGLAQCVADIAIAQQVPHLARLLLVMVQHQKHCPRVPAKLFSLEMPQQADDGDNHGAKSASADKVLNWMYEQQSALDAYNEAAEAYLEGKWAQAGKLLQHVQVHLTDEIHRKLEEQRRVGAAEGAAPCCMLLPYEAQLPCDAADADSSDAVPVQAAAPWQTVAGVVQEGRRQQEEMERRREEERRDQQERIRDRVQEKRGELRKKDRLDTTADMLVQRSATSTSRATDNQQVVSTVYGSHALEIAALCDAAGATDPHDGVRQQSQRMVTATTASVHSQSGPGTLEELLQQLSQVRSPQDDSVQPCPLVIAASRASLGKSDKDGVCNSTPGSARSSPSVSGANSPSSLGSRHSTIMSRQGTSQLSPTGHSPSNLHRLRVTRPRAPSQRGHPAASGTLTGLLDGFEKMVNTPRTPRQEAAGSTQVPDDRILDALPFSQLALLVIKCGLSSTCLLNETMAREGLRQYRDQWDDVQKLPVPQPPAAVPVPAPSAPSAHVAGWPVAPIASNPVAVAAAETPVTQQVMPMMPQAAPTQAMPMMQQAALTQAMPMMQQAAPTQAMPMIQQVAPTQAMPMMQQAAPTQEEQFAKAFIAWQRLGGAHSAPPIASPGQAPMMPGAPPGPAAQ